MQLHIRHETIYRYAEPVKRSVQNLRLTPRRDPVQRALNWTLHAPGRQHAQLDAHGNIVHLLVVNEAHREIRILVSGIVETAAAPHAALPNEGRLSPLAYLAATLLTQTDEPLATFARRQLRETRPCERFLLDLAHAVCEAVQYEKGATAVDESAVRAFARGKGVCQDQAHVFIACCRALGIPARYVSGYLHADRQAEVASHAWVDAWLGRESGWVSIDVTHRERAGPAHCRLAVGRDYLDAGPVRGVRRGGGAEEMRVMVNVATSAQQQ
jgi:transglutaminase-like putative cysteine protease